MCVPACTHIEMCKNVCVAGDGVTGGSSSPQTRLDDEGAGRAGGVCGAVSNLGHGLGLHLNEK